MKKNFKTGLVVLIVLLLIITGVTLLSVFNIGKKDSDSTPKFVSEYIALLKLEGTIEVSNENYDQKWILDNINKFKKDKRNKAIALYINSPGGAVYQADQVYLALKEYQATGKKIYTYFGPMAASGGYYVGCAGDETWANRNTLTGSIGVIAGQSFDLTEFLDDLGIKTETIHAGKNKTMMNFNEPFTDEQRQIMQSVADECYEQFCQIVSSERNLSMEKVYELADGRIYTANQAKTSGLIDFIGSSDSMMNKLKIDLDIPDCRIVTYEYEGKKSLLNMVLKNKNFKPTEGSANQLLPSLILEEMSNKNIYPAYLYR